MRVCMYVLLYVSLGTTVVQGADLETLSRSGCSLTKQKEQKDKRTIISQNRLETEA